MPCRHMIVVGKLFSTEDITNYSFYLGQLFKSSQDLVLILFSVKFLVKLRKKNGM